MTSSQLLTGIIFLGLGTLLLAEATPQTTPRVPEQLRHNTWTTSGNPVHRIIPVPDFSENPVHPRLFFNQEDVPALRERATREPFTSMIPLMRTYVESEALYNPAYALAWRARVMALLYVITGDQADADRTMEMIRELRQIHSPEHRGVWYPVSRRQLNLSEGSLSVAIAYDFCYHAWPEDFRREISRELAEQARVQLHDYGPGFPTRGSANNWRGIRFAGAGIALLASDEPHLTPDEIATMRRNPMDPSVDFAGIDPRWFDVAYDQVLAYMRNARTADPSARGMNAEGMGYMLYPHTHIGPFTIALRHMTGVNLAEDNPASALSPVLAAMSSLPIPAAPEEGRYPAAGNRVDLANENTHYASQGELAISLGTVLPEHLAAYKWHFDHFVGAQGTADFQPERAGLVFSYLNYPEQLPAENPKDSWGLTLLDAPTGTVILRDRYQDDKDVMFMTTARQRGVMRQTHHGAEIGTLRLFGEGTLFLTGGGRTTALGGQSIVLNQARREENDNSDAGSLEKVYLAENGSGSLTIHGSAAGVEEAVRMILLDTEPSSEHLRANLVVADQSRDGNLWRINTPGMHEVTLEERGFVITAPNGARLRGDVLFPRNFQLEQGKWDRAGTVSMHDQLADENHWIQVRVAEGDAPRFIVVMQVLPPEAEADVAELEADASIRVGDNRYRLEAAGLRRTDWPTTLDVRAEAVPHTGGQTQGTGQYAPGENVTLEARPAPGYRFVRWESPRPISGQPWKTEAIYPLKVSDHTHAKAIFEPMP
ncbi:MAG: hypothetical protein JJU29_21610 [Verrucomicrobia bacterium]|nr:hypothetical protein [Verrucomicrobiota bacterium]MCH8514190.1 hypothetical protein [Kiritimatiellia bacterium]